nr:ATP-grasp domain-containing protein [uncultured Pseudomonas sp.]
MSMKPKTVALWMYKNDNGHIPTLQLSNQLNARGLEVFHDFDMRDCYVLSGKVYTACGRCLSDDDVLFHMNADEQSAYQADILRALETSGVRIYNACAPFFACLDKFHTNQKLRKYGVRVPDAALLNRNPNPAVLESIFTAWGTVLFKPRHGHGASGIIRFDEIEQFNDFIQATNAAFEHYYLEQYIPFGERDFRVEILNGQCLGGYGRKKKHQFKTNISAGGEMLPSELGEEVEIARTAANVMKIESTIVDMIRSQGSGELYVLEVNPLLGIFVESAMRAGTKMPETEPDPNYCYDHLKINAIANCLEALARSA